LRNGEFVWTTRGAASTSLNHALVIIGYDDAKQVFKVQNSWGGTWKDSGYSYISYGTVGDVVLEAYLVTPTSATPNAKIINLTGNLAFGEVKTGTTLTLPFTITNIGNTDLTITNATASLGYTLNYTNGTIPANETKVVSVSFTPTTTQAYNGVIKIISNANAGIDSLVVTGMGK
jgi:Protein of unknown function (DUF1573)/Papain family cysteine protease